MKQKVKDLLANHGWGMRRYWEIIISKRFDVRDIIETTGRRLKEHLNKK